MTFNRRALLGSTPLLFLSGTAWGRSAIMSAPPVDTGHARPKVILLERNPWLMVIGSDSPAFALYEDGEAIYRTKSGYKSVTLDPAETMALLDGIGFSALPALARRYDLAPNTSDMPTEVIATFDGVKPSIISVRGLLKDLGPNTVVPNAVTTAYDRLSSFTHPKARDWLPEKVEVMIWPYEYAPDRSIIWPKEWPGLDSPDTVKRGEKSYSLYVPSGMLDDVRQFLGKRRTKGAVEIGGRKWAVSLRLPFPYERSWIDPLRDLPVDPE